MGWEYWGASHLRCNRQTPVCRDSIELGRRNLVGSVTAQRGHVQLRKNASYKPEALAPLTAPSDPPELGSMVSVGS